MATNNKPKDVVRSVRRESFAIAKMGEVNMEHLIRENVGGRITRFDLDRVRIPTGGGLSWSVPTLDGMESVPQIEGALVAHKVARAYWPGEFGGGNVPPECTSEDGETGHGVGGGNCYDCPMAEWGTSQRAGSRGKACKEMHVLFILRAQARLPIVVAVPPSSLKAIRNYLLRLSDRALKFYEVVTALGLEQNRNQQGIVYSQVIPKMVGQLAGEDLAAVERYHAELAPIFAGVMPDPKDWEGLAKAEAREY